ncbi:MAG: hypothetical protein Q7S92_06980 [Candidatus Diapherotrites archaeon]|nr:hypothetical protein [Candidatus Diapherotrites archaeon]
MKPIVRRLHGKTFRLLGHGAEAKVWEISRASGKKRKGTVFRRTNPKKFKTGRITPAQLHKRFIAHQIGSLLFPKNVMQVTELDLKKGRIRSKKVLPDKVLARYQAVTAEIDRITKLDEAIMDGRVKPRQRSPEVILAEIKQIQKLTAEKKRLYRQLGVRGALPSVRAVKHNFSNTGLVFDLAESNISIRDPNHPVFFEIIQVDVPKLETYLQENKTKLTAKQMEKLRGKIREYNAIHE